MQDFIGNDDQLVDTGPKHGDQPGDSREIHLELDDADEPEQDHDLRGIDENHGEYDPWLTVPVEDHKRDRNQGEDEREQAHRHVV